MVQVKFYNEKGNVSAKTREDLRTQAVAKLMSVLSADDMLSTATLTPNRSIAVPIAQDVGGDTIYLTLDLSLSTADPMVKKERKSKKAEPKVAEPTPNIFG